MTLRCQSPLCAICVLILSLAPSPASLHAADSPTVVQRLKWGELKAAGKLAAGEVIAAPDKDASEELVIRSADGMPAVLHVITLDNPGVGKPAYELRGRVRYEDVRPQGYLEMWNHFADGSYYFTRTLGTTGPMQALEGTAGWRPIALPFLLNGDAQAPTKPTRLVLNVVLPGKGVVRLSDFELVQLPTAELDAASGAWWSSRTTGLLGGVLGTLIGCWGALVGVLSSTGRFRAAVEALLLAGIVFGTLLLVVGLTALVAGQPFSVWNGLFFTGLITATLSLALRPSIRRRYEAAELRRMQALDVG